MNRRRMQGGILSLVMIVLLLGSMVYLCYSEEEAWNKYKAAHHCVITARNGDTITTYSIDSNGNLVGHGRTLVNRNEWACDDGTKHDR